MKHKEAPKERPTQLQQEQQNQPFFDTNAAPFFNQAPSIQAKMEGETLQRQPMEEEEEMLQPKLESETIQRQEEEEEEMMPKLDPNQSPSKLMDQA